MDYEVLNEAKMITKQIMTCGSCIVGLSRSSIYMTFSPLVWTLFLLRIGLVKHWLNKIYHTTFISLMHFIMYTLNKLIFVFLIKSCTFYKLYNFFKSCHNLLLNKIWHQHFILLYKLAKRFIIFQINDVQTLIHAKIMDTNHMRK